MDWTKLIWNMGVWSEFLPPGERKGSLIENLKKR